jgi:hypothetical protein
MSIDGDGAVTTTTTTTADSTTTTSTTTFAESAPSAMKNEPKTEESDLGNMLFFCRLFFLFSNLHKNLNDRASGGVERRAAAIAAAVPRAGRSCRVSSPALHARRFRPSPARSVTPFAVVVLCVFVCVRFKNHDGCLCFHARARQRTQCDRPTSSRANGLSHPTHRYTHAR